MGRRIGVIGTDTSHSIAFTELLNDKGHRHRVDGGEVVAAYPGGSPDFELSISRVGGFAEQLRTRFGVELAERPEQVAEQCDALLLLSADGRVHRELAEVLIPYRKPIFIDKPLALSLQDAAAIVELAKRYDVPLMSASALRYAEDLTGKLPLPEEDSIRSAQCYGPLYMEPTQPGYFWYGIHLAEMLYAIMGDGCEQVEASGDGDQEMIVARWPDGRIGTIRGSLSGGLPFAAAIHGRRSSALAYVAPDSKPFYASLLERVMAMFESGVPDVDPKTAVEIIRFIEAANESRSSSRPVYL